MHCSQCEGIEQEFDARKARSRLRKLQRNGADRTTRMLLEDVRAALLAAQTDAGPRVLLDIGAGVGAIHHELLEHGVERAIHVDASSAYLSVAREEVERRGHAGRVEFVRGDFVTVADGVPPVAVVTLDRVICCYPDMNGLVSRSAEKARSVYGAVYPRDEWWTRLTLAASNIFFRLKRSAFRVYLHRPRDIHSLLLSRGFERSSLRRTLAWEVAVYRRPGDSDGRQRPPQP